MRQDKGPFCQKNLKTKKKSIPSIQIGQGKGPFHQNDLKTQSFPQRQKIQNFLVVRISRTKTFQTERVNCFRNKNALRVRKSLLQTCHFYHVICQTFPHSLQLAYHPIICEFSNCGVYDKSFCWIFPNSSNCALFAKSFHIHCNWLIIQSFVNFVNFWRPWSMSSCPGGL